MSLQEAQRTVDAIVARMVAAGHPVEATNKRDHRPDHLPCDSYGGWKHEPNKWTGNTYFEDNLGSVLVGGWHSKAALVQLVIEMQRGCEAAKTAGAGPGPADDAQAQHSTWAASARRTMSHSRDHVIEALEDRAAKIAPAARAAVSP